jgi:hypothetical protein
VAIGVSVPEVVPNGTDNLAKCWSEWQDLNPRPPRPERGGLVQADMTWRPSGSLAVNAPVTAPKLMPASTLPPALGGRQALRTVIFLFRSNALMSNAAIFIYFPPKPLKCYVKHVTLNQRVQGSSPCAPTTKSMT